MKRRPSIIVLVLVAAGCTEDAPSLPEPRWDPPAAPAIEEVPSQLEPRPDKDPLEADVASLSIEQIAIGGLQHCLRMSNGTVRCWDGHGWNDLFTAAPGARAEPPLRGLRDVTKVAFGYAHGCALLKDRTVRCWGFNASGALGDGTGTDRSTPVPVLGLRNVIDLALGHNFGCALITDGGVRCWGENGTGELGLGIPTEYTPFDRRTLALPIPGLKGIAALAVGARHACALAAEGTVSCWGSALQGALGFDGAGKMVSVPTLVPGLHEVVQIAAGDTHTCARRRSGAVYCWGNNKEGQLGDGSVTPHPTPVAIHGFAGAVDLSAGRDATCALMSDASVRCAGLGMHTITERVLVPTAIPGLHGVRQLVAAGGCALLEDREVACWGYTDALTRFRW